MQLGVWLCWPQERAGTHVVHSGDATWLVAQQQCSIPRSTMAQHACAAPGIVLLSFAALPSNSPLPTPQRLSL